MIIIIHVLYWSFSRFYGRCRAFMSDGDGDLIKVEELDSILIDVKASSASSTSSDSKADVEIGIKFDPPVYLQRYGRIQEVLTDPKWRGKMKKAVDFGCAEFCLFSYMKRAEGIQEMLFVDIDEDLLKFNSAKVYPLAADYLWPRKEPLNIKVLRGSIADADPHLLNVDAVICIEIIEHLFPDTLDAFPHNIFEFVRPRIALFTTPNADFNVLFPNFPGRRHYDHKFEWTRQEFEDWARNMCVRYPSYSVQFEQIGFGPDGTHHLGGCSQMAVFTRSDAESDSFHESRYRELRKIDSKETKDGCVFCNLRLDVASSNVCTFESCSLRFCDEGDPEVRCRHARTFYKLMAAIEYPFEIDKRSTEEIFLQELEFCIHKLSMYTDEYVNEAKKHVEIPLEKLSVVKRELFKGLDPRNVLQNAGWRVEEHEVNGSLTECVIFEGNWNMSDASSKSNSSKSSDRFQYDESWKNESDCEPENASDLQSWHTSCTHVDIPHAEPQIAERRSPPSPEEVQFLFHANNSMSSSSVDLTGSLEINDAYPVTPPHLLVDVPEQEPRPAYVKGFFVGDDLNKSAVFPKQNKVEDVAVPPAPNVPCRAVPEPHDRVVENGDLANNNRDREGNNYQAAENEAALANDNAVERPEVLDEHNRNHIVLDDLLLDEDVGDEAGDIDDVSKEALYDPDSETSLILDAEKQSTMCDANTSSALATISEEHSLSEGRAASDMNLDAFPQWLLHTFNAFEEDLLSLGPHNSTHFFSQGDGIGIHPSVIEMNDSTSSSSVFSNDTVLQGTADETTSMVTSGSASETVPSGLEVHGSQFTTNFNSESDNRLDLRLGDFTEMHTGSFDTPQVSRASLDVLSRTETQQNGEESPVDEAEPRTNQEWQVDQTQMQQSEPKLPLPKDELRK